MVLNTAIHVLPVCLIAWID